MSMNRNALIAGLWSMCESCGFRIVSAATFLVLARIISPAAFGLMALAQVYSVVAQTICDQGITTALIQREILEDGHKNSVFWANLGVGLVLMALTLMFAGPLAALYGKPELAPILRWYSAAPLLSSLSVVQAALARRELRFRALALRQTIGAAVGGTAGIAMAVAGLGAWALVGQGLVGQAAGALILWSLGDWRPQLSFSRRHFLDISAFGASVLATDMMYILGGQADRLLLGYFFDTADLGYYSVAQRLIRIIADFVGGSTEGVVVPLFSRIQSDKERVARGIATAQSVLTVAVIPAFIGLAVTAPSLIHATLGPQWDASILPTRILALASLFYWLAFFFGHVITALGRPGLRLGIVTIRSLFQLTAVLIGARDGIVGVATGVALTQAVFYCVELAILYRSVRFSMRAYLNAAWYPGLASAVMAAAVMHIEHRIKNPCSVCLLTVEVTLGIAVYGALLLTLAWPRVRQLVDLAGQLRS
jgi:O-antigen/teichoic acid export membrane protein